MQGSRVLKFFMMVFGNALMSHVNFLDRLKSRLNLQEVTSEDQCDIIIAFVVISSRAGTDINAALEEIPASRPVVVVVLHHTFEEGRVLPDSRMMMIDRRDVFSVDCVFYEDKGLLRCERNDRAVKEVTDHLILMGASTNRAVILNRSSGNFFSENIRQLTLTALIVLVIVIAIATVASVYYFLHKPKP